MSLLALFDTGRSALFASQAALSVISNNIANANTPGYSRQEVILQVARPVEVRGDFIGRGVGNIDIKRHYNKFIHMQMIGQNHSFGRSYALDSGMSHVEQIFNEAQDLGLLNPMQEYFNAWQDVAANPEGANYRTTLIAKANELVRTARQMEGDLEGTIDFLNNEIAASVDRINTIAANIATLNEKVSAIEAGVDVEKASFFRDERDMLLNELGELMEFTWYDGTNGSVTVLVSGRPIVEGATTFELTTSLNSAGDRDVYYNGKEVNSLFQNGRLGGHLAVRDEIQTESLHDLRKLVASMTKETNILHRAGYGLDSSTNNDFFSALQLYTRDSSSGANITAADITSPAALTLDEYDINFTGAAAYEVRNHETNALVTSGAYVSGNPITFEGISVTITGTAATGDSFFVSPLTDMMDNLSVSVTDIQKIAAASASTDLPGDNRNSLSIVQLSQTKISNLDSSTYESYYRGIVSNVAVTTSAAADSLNYDYNLRNELQMKREETAGVSLDEEAANLIRYQHMFAAGARIINLTDELLETIINL